MPRLHVGTRVELRGLTKAAEHNGKYGSVVGNHGGERYKVQLVDEEKILLVKEANLVVDASSAGEDQGTADERSASERDLDQREVEEEDCCPLCLEPLVADVLDYNMSKSLRLTCCRKKICETCFLNEERPVLEACPLCRQATKTTPEEERERIRMHAERGQPWACYELGMQYWDGDGVRPNDNLAYEWFRKAADNGYIAAVHRVGLCYDTGRGVKQSDDHVAREWFQKAADVGYAPSQTRLAGFRMGKTETTSDGIRLLRLAAEQGYDIAQEILAMWYYQDADPRLAISWCLKAAKQNNPQSQHLLGTFLSGDRVPPPCAIYWFRKASAQGWTQCCEIIFEFRDDFICIF